MTDGPFPPRQTVFSDPEELGSTEAHHTEQWQTEQVVNGSPFIEASHEFVLTREAQKLEGISFKGRVR